MAQCYFTACSGEKYSANKNNCLAEQQQFILKRGDWMKEAYLHLSMPQIREQKKSEELV